MRFIFAILIVLIAVSVSNAQESSRQNYKLLWKISGKGLTKPSYLFGTMHVTDERAFDFSDSVLIKLEACDAFAMEVHPDSVIKFAFNKMFGGEETEPGSLKKLLTAAEYQELDSLLKARTGSSLNGFSTPREISQFVLEKNQRKDRNTFLDAWLYNIANRQGKTIIGLEKFSMQINLLNRNPKAQLERIRQTLKEDESEVDNSFTQLIDVYHSGDIGAIHKLSRQGIVSNYNEMITNRNVLMAGEIKKAINSQSTFIAVGAAHLPGEEGLVNLLQKAGYSVTLVQPVFTGLAKKYKYTSFEKQWEDVTSVDGGYVVSFPGKTMPFKPKHVPVLFNAYVDIGNPTVFMATHVPLDATAKTREPSETFDIMADEMKQKFEITSSKNIKVAGLPARELQLRLRNQVFLLRLVIRDSFLYMLMAGPSKEIIQNADTKRFMASLKPIALQPMVNMNVVNKQGAFSIDMPGKVMEQASTPLDETSGKHYKITLLLSVNAESGETFVVRYNDMIPGYVSVNDSAYYAETLASVVEMSEGVNVKQEKVVVEGFDGLQFNFETNKGEVFTQGFMLLRGNRFYLCLASRMAKTSPAATDVFLKSFKLLPYESGKTKPVSFPEGISLRVPENFETDSSIVRTDDESQYSWLDTKSGITYFVLVETLDPYADAESPDDYFQSIGELLKDENDSLISSRPVHVDNIIGHDFWFKSNIINTKKYARYLISGNKMISLWAYLPIDYAQSPVTQECFDSFTATSQSGFDLFKDKTGLLLQDILSADSTLQEEASDALHNHTFKETDLPKVYHAIESSLKQTNNTSISDQLLYILDKTHNETTPAFIEQLYPLLPDSTNLRDVALGVLASMRTADDTERMIKLLTADRTAHQFSAYSFAGKYFDSLELIAPWMPVLLKNYSRFESANTLFYQIKTCLDSGLFDQATRDSVISHVMDLANQFVSKGLPETNDIGYYENRYRLVVMAETLVAIRFSPELKDLILRFHNLNDAEIKLKTTQYLLQNGIKVDTKDIEVIAKDPSFRLLLYEALKKINQQQLIHKKYLTPEMVAESDLYEFLSIDDGIPDRVTLIAKRKVLYENNKRTLFVFNYMFNYDGEEEWLTAIAGPYDTSKGAAIQRGDLTYSLYELLEGKELDEYLKEIGDKNEMKLLD